MKGFPKTLNTKSDYEYVRQHFPKEECLPVFQELLDTEHDWFFDRYLDEGEVVEKDSTHRVEKPKEETSGIAKDSLYVFKSNPNCKMYALGYTKEEVEAIVKELSK